MWLRDGDTIFDVMSWVGHESTAALKRYAASLNWRSPKTAARQPEHSITLRRWATKPLAPSRE
jgi:hypothetical protein